MNTSCYDSSVYGPSKLERIHHEGEDYHKAATLSYWLFVKYDMSYKTFRNKSKNRRDELRKEFEEDTGRSIMGTERKTVRVVAAIIRDGDKIFATQRGHGEFKGGWEFPGGKIEPGETPEEALAREVREELETEIVVGERIDTIEYDYPTFHLSMDCFWAEVVSGELVLTEHTAAKWLTKEELGNVEWLPADVGLIETLREMQNESENKGQ